MSDSKQTRRDFLKAAAAGAAATSLALAPQVHAAGDDKIKVGIIGCGGRGGGAGENVLDAAPGVEIVALGDVFRFRVDGTRGRLQRHAQRSAAAKKFGNTVNVPDDRCFVGLDCHDKVIASGANYIILATPPGFRPVCIQAAVAAGKNIFTEKPVGVDGAGIQKVYAAYEEAKKKGLHIAAGTQRRHQTAYLEAMKRVHGGEIGDVTALRAYWNGTGIWFRKRDELKRHNIPDSDLAYQLHNWYHFLWTCGDHIVEQHVHNLDVCNWAMEPALKDKAHPVRALGMGSRIARPAGRPEEVGNIYDNFAIDFEYPNGVHMLSMCRQIPGCDNNVSEAVVGAKGTCITVDRSRYTIKDKPLFTRDELEAHTDPYVQEHTDLIASIRNGKPLNELKRVTDSTLTAILGRMAAYAGVPLKWEDALRSESTMPERLAWDMKLDVPPAPIPGRSRKG